MLQAAMEVDQSHRPRCHRLRDAGNTFGVTFKPTLNRYGVRRTGGGIQMRPVSLASVLLSLLLDARRDEGYSRGHCDCGPDPATAPQQLERRTRAAAAAHPCRHLSYDELLHCLRPGRGK